MVEKLTIVVTCTDRKSALPEPHLMVRNLAPGPVAERAKLWRDSLSAATHRVPLRKLYRGESWTQALRLEATAEQSGFLPRLIIASAGLGLIDASASAPAYAATFSARQDDSVGASTTETRAWWRHVASGSATARDHLRESTLLVLSKSYADAMQGDLDQLAGRDDVVIFGGSDGTPPDLRVAADRGLRSALGGTVTSLNLRTATAWLERLPAPRIPGYRDHGAWAAWAANSTREDRYDRQPITDGQVQDFIFGVRLSDPTLTKTRALRLLRDTGKACEQRRFGDLFQSAVEAT